ncbi:hypothetical protein V2J09_021921 [Rumex salicifolius]
MAKPDSRGENKLARFIRMGLQIGLFNGPGIWTKKQKENKKLFDLFRLQNSTGPLNFSGGWQVSIGSDSSGVPPAWPRRPRLFIRSDSPSSLIC